MLIIPTSMALEIPGIHFGHPSWAVKSGAPQGRNVHDISYSEVPEHILNGSRPSGRSWLQTRCEDRWGPIHLLNLHAIMTMILGVVDREGISEVLLWAKDLKGAFTLLRFHPSQSRLFALSREKSSSSPVLKNCGFKGFLRPAKVPGLNFKTLVPFMNAENARTGNNWLWLRLPVIN